MTVLPTIHLHKKLSRHVRRCSKEQWDNFLTPSIPYPSVQAF